MREKTRDREREREERMRVIGREIHRKCRKSVITTQFLFVVHY